MLGIIPTIDPTTTIQGIEAWSLPWFSELLPLVYIALGAFVAGTLIYWIVYLFEDRSEALADLGINRKMDWDKWAFWKPRAISEKNKVDLRSAFRQKFPKGGIITSKKKPIIKDIS